MKITAIKLHTLEHPTLTQAGYRLKQTSGLRRIQYTHIPLSTTTPMQMQILDVETDEGITGRIAPASITKCQLDILKTHAVGESPFARERLFQMLHKGTRWVYQDPGWFGDFDNCLWDIAGKAAGLPVCWLTDRGYRLTNTRLEVQRIQTTHSNAAAPLPRTDKTPPHAANPRY
jgi:L-alanine-DL-glutamate epimerase-like enolase superfamily enzyme